MYDNIKVNNLDFFETNIASGTFVLFNPPYGERMELGSKEFYEDLGNTLKHKYEDCTVWIISSDIKNMKLIGLRPSNKIKIINGQLECTFRKFEIYKGSKKNTQKN